MKESPIYANAVISCREGRLLTSDRIRRMVDAPTAGDALKVLYECGYNESLIFDNPDKIDLLLSDEMERTVTLFFSLCGDEDLKELVLTRFDYHNCKVLVKAACSDFDIKTAVYPFGTEGLKEKIYSALKSGYFGDLPPIMGETVSRLVKDFEKGFSPKAVDIELDKAFWCEAGRLTGSIDKGVRAYYRTEADLINLMTYMRTRTMQLSLADAEAQYAAGGTLDTEKLSVIITAVPADIVKAFASTDYYDLLKRHIAEIENGILTGFEDSCTEYLMECAEADKDNMFTVRPLFHWYIKKIDELKTVKLIILCKSINIPSAVLRYKLRRAYE